MTVVRRLCLLACLLAPQALAREPAAAGPAAKTGGEDRFAIRNVEGWTVYINRDLPKQYPRQLAETLNHLKWELYQIKLAAPALALSNMQEKNAIWIEHKEEVDLSYHPERSWLLEKGYTIPRDPESFMSLSIATHVGDSYRHPFVVFHELAHGYDYHFIGNGKDYGNPECQANYERMMKDGKYERVRIWNDSVGSHYARTNRMEYWAESSEAYFAVNDIYPFVRAELREHDPKMVGIQERYWGVDPAQVARLEADLASYLDARQASAGGPQAGGGCETTGKFIATGEYDKRDIDGWTVYVSPQLTARAALSATRVTLLHYKLHMIDHFVGDQGRRQLHQVPIWLEIGQPGPYVRYCGSKEQLAGEMANPDKFGAVEVRDPQRMMNWALLEQSDILHELALAYYDLRAAKKAAEAGGGIRGAYEQAVKDGKYNSILRFDGKHLPLPAMASEREYFAELMESYFLVNDHYPFVRCELKEHDPVGYRLMAGLWEGVPRR